MNGRRWPWVALAFAGVSSIGVGVYGTASAQEGGTLVVGLGGIARSDGIGATFGNPDTPPYPTAASQIAHTEAVLSTGPSGYALASTAWPGPLVANAGSVVRVLNPNIPPEASAANYGGRAEAYSPAGPHDASLPGMRARADGGVAESEAGAQDIEGQPGVATADVRSRSRSTFESGVVNVTTSCTASDIDIGDAGAVHIGSVHTEANATSDGATGTSGGRTVVSGATVAGEEVVIDEEGVRFVDPIVAPVGEQLLSQMGIEMFVAAPRQTQAGERATYGAGPLVIVWELPESGGYRWVYSICGSDADAALRLGTPFQPPAPPANVLASGSSPVAPRPSPAPPVPRSPASVASVPAAPPAGTDVALDVAPASFARDLATWPYVLGALCCVAAAIGLVRGRDAAVAARSVAAACPLQGGAP